MLRKLCPERQAVNISELEKLLDADSLQKLVEELNNSEDEAKDNPNSITHNDSQATSK